MTVAELIEKLSRHPQGATVFVNGSGNCTDFEVVADSVEKSEKGRWRAENQQDEGVLIS